MSQIQEGPAGVKYYIEDVLLHGRNQEEQKSGERIEKREEWPQKSREIEQVRTVKNLLTKENDPAKELLWP